MPKTTQQSDPKPTEVPVNHQPPPEPAAAPVVVDEVDRDTMGEAQEFQRVTQRNPRADVLKRIADQAAEAQGHDEHYQLDESGDRPRMVVNDGNARRTVEAPIASIDDNGVTRLIAEAGEELPPEQPAPEQPAPEQPAPEPQRVRIPVLGEEREFTADQVYEAGMATLSKQSAADIRLREANALLDEAQRINEQARRGQPQPAQPQPEQRATPEEAQRLADAVIRGDRDETARAFASILDRGVSAESVRAQASQDVATQVQHALDHRDAVAQLHRDLPEINVDPYFRSMAANEERRLRMNDAQRGVHRSYAEVYRDVATNLNAFKARYGFKAPSAPAAGNGGSTLQIRQQAKEATPAPVVGSGGRPAPVAAQKPPSGSQVIAKMREQRGQGRPRI
jgi:hypothetical protein